MIDLVIILLVIISFVVVFYTWCCVITISLYDRLPATLILRYCFKQRIKKKYTCLRGPDVIDLTNTEYNNYKIAIKEIEPAYFLDTFPFRWYWVPKKEALLFLLNSDFFLSSVSKEDADLVLEKLARKTFKGHY